MGRALLPSLLTLSHRERQRIGPGEDITRSTWKESSVRVAERSILLHATVGHLPPLNLMVWPVALHRFKGGDDMPSDGSNYETGRRPVNGRFQKRTGEYRPLAM